MMIRLYEVVLLLLAGVLAEGISNTSLAIEDYQLPLKEVDLDEFVRLKE